MSSAQRLTKPSPMSMQVLYLSGDRARITSLVNLHEKVQKRVVKLILSEQGHHYNEFEYFRRLLDLELLPIQYRFILNDLVFFHKIFYRYCPVAFP